MADDKKITPSEGEQATPTQSMNGETHEIPKGWKYTPATVLGVKLPW